MKQKLIVLFLIEFGWFVIRLCCACIGMLSIFMLFEDGWFAPLYALSGFLNLFLYNHFILAQVEENGIKSFFKLLVRFIIGVILFMFFFLLIQQILMP